MAVAKRTWWRVAEGKTETDEDQPGREFGCYLKGNEKSYGCLRLFLAPQWARKGKKSMMLSLEERQALLPGPDED